MGTAPTIGVSSQQGYYFAATNQPGTYLVYQYPNLVNPVAYATLNGNTLTLGNAGSFPNAAATPINFFNGTQSVPAAVAPPRLISTMQPIFNGTQSMPTAAVPPRLISTMQPITQTNPTSVAGMRVEEPQHTKLKRHRGKKHCKRKH